MHFILLLIGWNSLLIPLVTASLLFLLPSGEVLYFRLLAPLLLLGLNLPIWKFSKPAPAETPKKLMFPSRGFLILCLTLGLLTFILLNVIRPLGMWDAWAMWNMKARDYAFSFMEGTPFVFSRPEWGHPQYPPLYPMLLAFFSIMGGGWSQALPVLVNLVCYLFPLGLFLEYARQQEFNREPFFSIFWMSLIILPNLWTMAINQSADLFLVAQFMFGFYLILHERQNLDLQGTASEHNRFNLISIGFVVGALSLIKSEGMILAPFMGLGALLILGLHRKPVSLALLLFSILLPVLALLFYKHYAVDITPYPMSVADFLQRIITPMRYVTVLKYFGLNHIITSGGILLLALGFALGKSPGKTLLYTLPLILPFLVYHAIFIVTPSPLEWHLNTAYSRITTQLYPAAVLIFLHLLNEKTREDSDALF